IARDFGGELAEVRGFVHGCAEFERCGFYRCRLHPVTAACRAIRLGDDAVQLRFRTDGVKGWHGKGARSEKYRFHDPGTHAMLLNSLAAFVGLFLFFRQSFADVAAFIYIEFAVKVIDFVLKAMGKET